MPFDAQVWAHKARSDQRYNQDCIRRGRAAWRTASEIGDADAMRYWSEYIREAAAAAWFWRRAVRYWEHQAELEAPTE